jgi:hypothetical protein
MNRYILLYTGAETPPDTDVQQIRTMPGLRIVDAALPLMCLIEATDAAVQQLREMPSWSVTLDRFIPLPDTRKRVRKPSGATTS